LSNDREFSEDSRGKNVRCEVIFDEEYCNRALDWVRSHFSVKGNPIMVASNSYSMMLASQIRIDPCSTRKEVM